MRLLLLLLLLPLLLPLLLLLQLLLSVFGSASRRFSWVPRHSASARLCFGPLWIDSGLAPLRSSSAVTCSGVPA